MPVKKAAPTKKKPTPKPTITLDHIHEHLLNFALQFEEIFKQLSFIKNKQIKMAQSIQELKDQIAAQSSALDNVSTNVAGIQADVTALKAKIDELNAGGDAAVAAALAELSPLVDGVGSKIDAIGATTADLDAQTP